MQKVPISFLIAVKNSALRIKPVLESITWADEIVLVDSLSQDGIEAIALHYGATIIQFENNQAWPKKRNWALTHHPWKHKWIFILDDDEVLPPLARQELYDIVNNPTEHNVGYWVNRRFWFIDRWLQHCYFPSWNLRLFQTGRGFYEKLSNSQTHSGDVEVHEHIVVTGSTAKLNFVMDHYAFPSIYSFIEKHNRYSNWEACIYLEDGWGKCKGSWKRSLRRCIKHLPFRPLMRFLYIYIIQGGWMDGRAGLYFARLHGIYEFLIIAKEYELKQKNKILTSK